MKTLFKLSFFTLVVVILFSSNSYTPIPNPRIGNFSIYREVTSNDIISYFGEPTEKREFLDEDENGQDCNGITYTYLNNNKKDFQISFFPEKKRIRSLLICKRDEKYAINGILMVGDSISKVNQLGYTTQTDSYTISKKYIVVNLPDYHKNNYDYYYDLEVYYNENNIIRMIRLLEDTGI